MSKKSITLIIFILFVSFGIISLYTTFAFNEEDTKMDESQANYNLIYPLNDLRKQEVVIPSGEEKNVDIAITNTYNTTLRYGLCYKLVSPDTKPDELVVSTASESDNPSESTIKTGENKIITIKVIPAVENKESGHWSMPGLLSNKSNSENNIPPECYETITKDYILNKVKKDSSVIAVNAATPGVFWWDKDFRNALGKNYTDVGIAEQHAVAYSSGLAKGGAKPIFGVMTSFIQRTYDQLSQDLALNNNPATILVYWGGISSADATHLGLFDIPLICNIPNIVYLAPTNKEEYLKMLDWSVEQTKYPVAIRVPAWNYVSVGVPDTTDYSLLNKYSVVESGNDVAIIALGDFFELGREVKQELMNKLGVEATLINPKFITGIDKELLNSLKQNHKVVITLENGTIDGGFGEKIARYYGNSNIKVLVYGANKEFNDRIPMDELLTRYRLKKELITEDIKNVL